MRTIPRTTQFKKDVKRMQKRDKYFNEFKEVIDKIFGGQVQEPQYRDHALIGEYKGARECHIESDWLLIYERTEDELVLIRTGTHSDLFG